jgi:hypothetical protein
MITPDAAQPFRERFVTAVVLQAREECFENYLYLSNYSDLTDQHRY